MAIVKSGSAYTTPVTETYVYDTRDQLISGQGLSYAYDDIGNRTVAEGKTYTANALNQYTKIDDFVPQYDADGNQTLIQTSTGIWRVTYNAENRPIRWEQGETVIEMAFDRMGRRVEMRTQSADSNLLQRFVYDNYLCIQQLRGTDNTLFQSYVWDPTEPIATRPLVFQPVSGEVAYYFHDGNKNVSDLVPFSGTPIHYAYTSFGAPTASAPSENPFGFSSEVCDNQLGLVYYNYRHYHSDVGRWYVRDVLNEYSSLNLFIFVENAPLRAFDYLGLVWGNSGAVYHYFTGGGRRVWLTETGHYDTVTSSIASSRQAWRTKMITEVSKLSKQISCPCTPVASKEKSDIDDVHSGVFWIGGIALFRNYSCTCAIDGECDDNPTTWTCTCRAWYDMRDMFEDPLDFDNSKGADFWDHWTLGGTPFEVYSRWEDTIYTLSGEL